jgi:hypothetical protein
MATAVPDETDSSCLTHDLISKLRFRELQSELKDRDLPMDGTTGQLRGRLRGAVGLDTDLCVVNEDGIDDDCQDAATTKVSEGDISSPRPATPLPCVDKTILLTHLLFLLIYVSILLLLLSTSRPFLFVHPCTTYHRPWKA